MRALEMAMSAPWAMLPEHIEQLLDVTARENNTTPEALEALGCMQKLFPFWPDARRLVRRSAFGIGVVHSRGWNEGAK